MYHLVKRWRKIGLITVILAAILLCPVKAVALTDGASSTTANDCDLNCEGCSFSVRSNISRAPADNGLNLAVWISIAVLITGVIALAYYIKHRRKSALNQ